MHLLTRDQRYLEAIQAANANITYSPITEITATGIHTADGFQSFDLIIFATGFQPGVFPPFPVRGHNGFILGADRKTKAPEAYFGMCTPQLHIYFSFTGPKSPVGNGSFAPVLSWTADYILKWCEEIAREDIGIVVVKQRPFDAFMVYAQEFLKRTVRSEYP
jgi:cation diffusion facilitator CzcD-associated flavoprotein CzcO